MLIDYIKTLPQHLIPHHLFSHLVAKLVTIQQPTFKNWSIRRFIRLYGVDMNEALQTDITQYRDFNHFFTRELAQGVRPIVQGRHEIASPVDGIISQVGDINSTQLLQAKGTHFGLHELLGGVLEWTELFTNGKFMTLYLAPRHYHRVHMPLTGELQAMHYIPGRLFSVQPRTTRTIKKIFARNERVVCLFKTQAGPMAVILVGAMLVNGINTLWHGQITPKKNKQPHHWRYPNPKAEKIITIARGDEMGHFQLGSTVIVLFAPNQMQWTENLAPETEVQLGQLLGTYKN